MPALWYHDPYACSELNGQLISDGIEMLDKEGGSGLGLKAEGDK